MVCSLKYSGVHRNTNARELCSALPLNSPVTLIRPWDTSPSEGAHVASGDMLGFLQNYCQEQMGRKGSRARHMRK